MEKEHLIVYKNDPFNGVWTSKTNLLRYGVGAFPTPFTKVGESGIFYSPKDRKFFIELLDGVVPGEIIIVGKLSKEYRIQKQTRFSKKGRLGFAIERMDGEVITSLDVHNAEKGAKVRIRGRKTTRETLKVIDEL